MEKCYKGKARDLYNLDNDTLVMVATDRISVHTSLPYNVKSKGIVLNKLSEFWFEKYKNIIQNHMITTDLKEMPLFFRKENFKNRCMKVKKLKMFRVECIVRGYLAGSCYEKYVNNQTICGIILPENLKLSQKLEQPIFTPTTKEDNGNDSEITYLEFESIVGKTYAKQIKDTCIAIYRDAHKFLLNKGIILADTKMEFGIDDNNQLVLADELLTPDCSRFWLKNSYQLGKEQTSFDREELKNYIEKNRRQGIDVTNNIPVEILDRIHLKYLEIYKIITNKEL